MKTAKDYYTTHMVVYEEPETYSWTSITIAEFLIGKPWDNFALDWMLPYNPTSIRVTEGEIMSDARTGRITVIIDKNNIIEEITQEVRVGLSAGLRNGNEMSYAIENVEPITTR